MKTIQNIFCLALLGFLFLACAKDGQDGAIGPQGSQGIAGTDGQDGSTGPAGTQGEQGISGSDGDDGAEGEAGTANIIYSEWIPVDFGETPITETSATFGMPVNNLSQEILDKGLLMVYGRRNLLYYPLSVDLSFEYPGFQQYFSYNFFAENNRLIIKVFSTNDSSVWIPFFTDIRYIILPGGIPASGKTTIDYSKMSYGEVVAHFNIKD